MSCDSSSIHFKYSTTFFIFVLMWHAHCTVHTQLWLSFFHYLSLFQTGKLTVFCCNDAVLVLNMRSPPPRLILGVMIVQFLIKRWRPPCVQDPVVPEQCAVVTEKLGEYLITVGYWMQPPFYLSTSKTTWKMYNPRGMSMSGNLSSSVFSFTIYGIFMTQEVCCLKLVLWHKRY